MNTVDRIRLFARHCNDDNTLALVILNSYINMHISLDSADELMYEFGFADINSYWSEPNISDSPAE